MGTISFLIGDLLVAINLMTKSFLNLKNKARKENLSKKYHRAFGVYGIIQKNNKLLVIKKMVALILIDLIYLAVV